MRLAFVVVVGASVAMMHPVSAQTCTNVNNLVVCDNGLLGNRFGNSVFWSDGSTSAGVPTTTYINPQTIPRLGGEPIGPMDGRVDRSGPPEVPATERWPSLGR